MSKLFFIFICVMLIKSFSFEYEPEAYKYAKKLSTLYNNTRLPKKIDTSTVLNMVKSNENYVNIFYKKKGRAAIKKQKVKQNVCRKLKSFLNKGVVIKSIYQYEDIPHEIIVLNKNDCV